MLYKVRRLPERCRHAVYRLEANRRNENYLHTPIGLRTVVESPFHSLTLAKGEYWLPVRESEVIENDKSRPIGRLRPALPNQLFQSYFAGE
jgi:hypothetical protein